jgi:hypothetical protein
LSQAEIDTQFLKDNLKLILGGAVGAFAIGYGIASINMMSNLLASIYSRQRFNVGDTIQVGDGGSSRVDLQACKLGTGRRFTTS